MDKALEQLVEGIKQASPMLWAAAQHKVEAQIQQDVYGMWICACLALIGWTLVLLDTFGAIPDSDAGGIVLGGITGLGGTAGLIAAFLDYRLLVMARDWYAIKALAELSPLK